MHYTSYCGVPEYAFWLWGISSIGLKILKSDKRYRVKLANINTKGSNISETREAKPIKIGVQAFDINLYLHEFFEPIPID